MLQNPMDMRTIGERMESGYYRSLHTFAADFRRIFANARTFNPPRTFFYKARVVVLLYGGCRRMLLCLIAYACLTLPFFSANGCRWECRQRTNWRILSTHTLARAYCDLTNEHRRAWSHAVRPGSGMLVLGS